MSSSSPKTVHPKEEAARMPVRRSTFLIAAFGALLLLSALAAWAVWRNTSEAQVQAAAWRERDLRIHQALDTIRNGVYLNAILTRDYLLDSEVAHVRTYVDQFDSIRENTKSSVNALESVAHDEAPRSTLRRLRMELEAYWETTHVMLSWSAEEKSAQKTALLRQRIQRRQDIFALTQQIEQLASEHSLQEREQVEAAARDFRSSLGWTAGIALLLGLGISAFTLVRMRALESQSQAAEVELRLLTGRIRTTQEEERKSLSRELHDQVGQMLTGLRMELAAVSRLQADPQSEMAVRLDRAKGTVEQTLGIVRNIAMLLRPSMLDDLGLTPALNWLVKEFSRSSGISIQAQVNSRVDELPDAHRTCLYRVVQEALTNTTRHAGARSVYVDVNCFGNWVQAIISDDGKGFEPGAEKRKGLGLLGMEERVRELGGTIRLISAPGRGTSVEIRLPCPISAEDTKDENSDRGRPRDRPDRIKTLT